MLSALLVSALLAATAARDVLLKEIQFSGERWIVKDSRGERVGPGPNLFSESNVWVDPLGRLHLRIQKEPNGAFSCAEVVLARPLGYGTYRFHLANPVYAFDPAVVLGFFTFSDDPAYSHREIDVEVSRFRQAAGPNAHYSVQPSEAEGHKGSFFVGRPWPRSIHAFTWREGAVQFESFGFTGDYARVLIGAFTYTGPGVPEPGGESTRINLWIQGAQPLQHRRSIEVILEAFTFEPR
jgi:hypothetical protein